jgi:hypothetical protein
VTEERAFEIASAKLEPGEKLLWSGIPKQGLLLRTSDCLLIPFSLMWGGFAFFWEAAVIASGAQLLFALWGIPFVLIGCYITVGRFVVDAQVRSRTAYAVTSRRVLFVREGVGATMCSRPLETLSEISLRCRPDGVGSVTLDGAATGWGASGTRRYSRSPLMAGPMFGSVLEGCQEADRVHGLLLSAREERLSSGTHSR